MSKTEEISSELEQATGTRKCHACGCFQDAVTALADSEIGERLRDELARGREAFRTRKYDCLGCDVCWPAKALNLAADIVELPAGVGCATEIPEVRDGWPPYPGDYRVGSFGGTVAVCTLHSRGLVDELAQRKPTGLALVGSLQTENLGIERIIQNVVANPNVRRLVVCGEDTNGRVGHFPGQTLLALAKEGLADDRRILGARGKRPILENLDSAWAAAFREQVEVVDRRGVCSPGELSTLVEELAEISPGPASTHHDLRMSVRKVSARPPESLVLDPAGYVVIYADRRRGRLVAEHYENRGTITTVIEGRSADYMVATLLAEGLVTRLDHAAYLGRELALAESALENGTAYHQDGAPEPPSADQSTCRGGCCCTHDS